MGIVIDEIIFDAVPGYQGTYLSGAGIEKIYTPHNLSAQDAIDLIANWQRKRKLWPSEISIRKLSEHLTSIYVPFWIVNGNAEGQFNALVTMEYKRFRPCSKCNERGKLKDDWTSINCSGSGEEEVKDYKRENKSGFARGQVSNLPVKNYDESFSLRFPKGPFWVNKIKDIFLNVGKIALSFDDKLTSVIPISTSINEGRKIARNLVFESLAEDAKKSAKHGVYSLHKVTIYDETFISLGAKMWLYPQYVSVYEYGGESYVVQVDGITKKLFIQKPKGLQGKQFAQNVKIKVSKVLGSIRNHKRKLLFSGLVVGLLGVIVLIAFIINNL